VNDPVVKHSVGFIQPELTIKANYTVSSTGLARSYTQEYLIDERYFADDYLEAPDYALEPRVSELNKIATVALRYENNTVLSQPIPAFTSVNGIRNYGAILFPAGEQDVVVNNLALQDENGTILWKVPFTDFLKNFFTELTVVLAMRIKE